MILKIKENNAFVDIPALVGEEGIEGAKGPVGAAGRTGSNSIYNSSEEPAETNVLWANSEDVTPETSIANPTIPLLNNYGSSITDAYTCDYINNLVKSINKKIQQFNKITFSITVNSYTHSYTAQKGMTWGEWVESEYNNGVHVWEIAQSAGVIGWYVRDKNTISQYITETNYSTEDEVKALVIEADTIYTLSFDREK